jgi:formiminoglutamase
MNIAFHKFSQHSVRTRAGETRLGQDLIPYENAQNARFLILGISEDIGPRANFGVGGANKAFDAFLNYFIHMQSNRFVEGSEVCILGKIDCQAGIDSDKKFLDGVAKLDQFTFDFLTKHLQPKQKLIVIGGGHNNALPIIESIHAIRRNKVDVVNLDPHADCRELEGRHSGNSFSYAFDRELLNSYTVLGLHRAYNNESSLSFLENNSIKHSFFEDYILNPSKFEVDLIRTRKKLIEASTVGVELDLDAIIHMPSSARTPSGFSLEDARKYVAVLSPLPGIAYLHLPEGAPQNQTEEITVGKSLAYLVWDFLYWQKANHSIG